MMVGKVKRALGMAFWFLVLAGFVAFAIYQGMSA
jgi:hypothetical protein